MKCNRRSRQGMDQMPAIIIIWLIGVSLASAWNIYAINGTKLEESKGKRNTYLDQRFYEKYMSKGVGYRLIDMNLHYKDKWTHLRCDREKSAIDYPKYNSRECKTLQ
jgi:hypothetical protein